MQKNKKLFYLFIGLAMMQLAAPLYMIWHWEDVLQNGRQYHWVTAPVDPYDALRGRYVDLGFKERKIDPQGGETFKRGQTAYAMIAENEKGYAVVTGISSLRPEGNSYVKIKVSYVQQDGSVHFVLPFKRYYMQEDMAPAAETAYRKNAEKDGIVVVRIKDGYGVLEELYIGDQKIYDYLHGEEK